MAKSGLPKTTTLRPPPVEPWPLAEPRHLSRGPTSLPKTTEDSRSGMNTMAMILTKRRRGISSLARPRRKRVDMKPRKFRILADHRYAQLFSEKDDWTQSFGVMSSQESQLKTMGEWPLKGNPGKARDKELSGSWETSPSCSFPGKPSWCRLIL